MMVQGVDQSEQTADIEGAWLEDCRLLRKQDPDDEMSNTFLVVQAGMVVGHFTTWQGSDGLNREEVDPLVSRVGDRVSLESLKANGYEVNSQRLTIRFNPLTLDVEKIARPPRSRK